MTTGLTVSITDELVSELEALASKATPGPWKWDGREVDDEGYVYIPECSYLVGAICLADNYEGYQDDCDFMAAANPSVIRALLAEREGLKQALADADAAHTLYGGQVAWLEKDALRYRWLREQEAERGVSVININQWLQPAVCVAVTFADGSFVDHAIDAAMQSEVNQ